MSDTSELQNCTQCSHHTAWLFQLNHHVRRKHAIIGTTKLFYAIVEPEQFSCIYCDYKSCHQIELYEHYKQSHSNNGRSFRRELPEYSCEHCKYISNSSLFVTKHRNLCRKARRKVLPPVIKSNSTANNISFCDEFAKFISTRHTYEGISQHQCDQCSYRTIRSRDLQRHMLQHAAAHEIDWFRCEQCAYQTTRKYSLQKHMLRHAGREEIDWFRCEQCSYRTKRRIHLNEHAALKHAADDQIVWLQCDRCPYRAKIKSYLRRHMVQHAPAEQITWYQCAYCSHRTKRNRSLKKHVMRKHVVKRINKL